MNEFRGTLADQASNLMSRTEYLAGHRALEEKIVEKRKLGRSGLEFAPIAFGGNVFGWTADEKQSFAVLDAYADAHKHAFGARVAIYGEEDWVIALAGLAAEIGMLPVLCASGGKSGLLQERLAEKLPAAVMAQTRVLSGVDFADIEDALSTMQPDLMVGNSKGYTLARKLNIPLARFGFPIHDRIGGQRLLHLGYEGTQRLFDQWVNALIERRQAQSPVGYAYM